MVLSPEDTLLLNAQKRREELESEFKAKYSAEAFNQLRAGAGHLVTDPKLKEYLSAAEALESSASGVAGKIMTTVNLANDLSVAVRLLDTAPRYDLGYNSEFAQVGSAEIGASRELLEAVVLIQQKSIALQGALSAVSTLLAIFPPTALAGVGLGLLSTLLGEANKLTVLDSINELLAGLPAITSNAKQAEQYIQDFVDLPVQGGIGRFIDESGGGGGLGGGVSSSRSSSPDNPGRSDPIVIDVDGDGVELVALDTDPVFFDRQGNGIATATGWVAPDDGLLARDTDGDGKIRTQAELFGNDTLNAFDDLQTFDTDGNGRIDENDAIWSDLLIWRDLNQDGESQSNELFSLESLGVAAISLDRQDTVALVTSDNFESVIGTYDISGNQVDSEGFVIFDDGRQQDAFAIAFQRADSLGQEVLPDGFVIEAEAAELPNLPAGGTLSSLAVAMTNDARLLSLMQKLVEDAPTLSGPAFSSRLEAVFQRWSGIKPGKYEDETAYRAAFLSKTLMADPSVPFVEGANAIDAAYEQFMDSRGLRIAIQIGEQIQAETPDIAPADNPFHAAAVLDYSVTTQFVTATGRDVPLRSLTEALGAAMTGDVAKDFDYLTKAASHLQGIFTDFYEWRSPVFEADFAPLLEEALANPMLARLALDIMRAPVYEIGTKQDNAIEISHPRFMRDNRNDLSVVDGGRGDDSFSHAKIGKKGFVDPGQQLSLIYRQGDGHDTLDMSNTKEALTRLYLPDFLPGEVFASVSTGKAPQLVLVGGSITFERLSSADTPIEIHFADGSTWSQDEVLAASALAGSNTLTGTNGADVLIGGTGNDTLEGLAGDDIYVFRAGDGVDSVIETSKTLRGIDTVVLQDVMPDALTVRLSGEDAILSSKGAASDKVRLVGQFNSTGLDVSRGVEVVRLADGSELDADDLIRIFYEKKSTRASDEITGTARDEVFTVSSGNDLINVGSGNDVVIRPANLTGTTILTGTVSELILEEDPTDIVLLENGLVTGDGYDVQFLFENNSSLILTDYLSPFSIPTQIIYPDGSIQTGGRLRSTFDPPDAYVLQPIAIMGTINDDIQTGTAHSDTLFASSGDDTLRGGAGSDLYEWQPRKHKSDDDVIEERGQSENASSDYLIVDAPQSEVTLERLYSGDLRLTHEGTSATMTISSQFRISTYQVEWILFQDGGISVEELLLMPVLGDDEAQTILGSSDPDFVKAAGGNDVVFARDGDDIVEGQGGDDTLRGEDGDDAIKGGTGDDVLDGGDGDDTLDGGKGDDRIDGDLGDDVLNGGPGDDDLRGEGGSDTYLFAAGDGIDMVTESTQTRPDDVNYVEISGVSASDLTFLVEGSSGYDLRIRYTGQDAILVPGQFNPLGGRGIFGVKLDDGRVLSRGDILERSEIAGSAASETIVGPYFDTRIDSGAGDDTIYANSGDQVFFWGPGDGNDFIQSQAALDAAPEDRLVLRDLAFADVKFSRGSGDEPGALRDLVITQRGGKETLTLDDQFGYQSTFSGREGVSFFEFTDRTLTREDLLGLASIQGGGKADVLEGSSPADTFIGKGGDDSLSGFDGGDLYIWRIGDGSDVITDQGSGGIDVLDMRDLNLAGATFWREAGTGDVLVGPASGKEAVRIKAPVSGGPGQDDSIEQIRFADGAVLTIDDIAAIPFAPTAKSDQIGGDRRANVLVSDGGTDTLKGLGGADVYRPGKTGTTRIEDAGGSDGDLLVLSAFKQKAVTASLDKDAPDSVTIKLPKGKVTLVDQLVDGLSGVETIRFADGDVAASDFFASVGNAVITGSKGKDTLKGSWLDEVFKPLAGNDTLTLGGGQDVVKISRKSGRDTIKDFATGPNGDIVDLTTDPFATFGKLKAAASEQTKGVTIDLGGGNKVTLLGIDKADLQPGNFGFGASLSGTNKDDVLSGTPFGDVLEARGGNDTVLTGSGNDTVLGGGGNDVIRLGGGSNTVDGGAGYDRVEISGADPVTVDLVAGTLVIAGQTTTLDRIEALTFGGGDDLFTGSAQEDFADLGDGDDRANGGEGDDILLGGADNDRLTGDAGQDLLVGGTGEDTADYGAKASRYLYALSSDGGGLVVDLRDGSPDGTDVLVAVEQISFANKTVSTALDADAPVLRSFDSGNYDAGGNNVVLQFDKQVTWSGKDPVLLIDPSSLEVVARLDATSDISVKGKAVAVSIPDDVARSQDLALVIGAGAIEGKNTGAPFGGLADTTSVRLAAHPGSNTVPVAKTDDFATDRASVLSGDLLDNNGSGRDTDKDGDALVLSSGASLMVEADGDLRVESVSAAEAKDVVEGLSYSISDRNDEASTTSLIEIAASPAFSELCGTSGADHLAGSGDRELLIGARGPNTLIAQGGDDRREGRGGNETLTGDAGEDLFVFAGNWGADTLKDFTPGSRGEKLVIAEVGSASAFTGASGQDGKDPIYDLNYDGNTVLIIDSIEDDALNSNEFDFV